MPQAFFFFGKNRPQDFLDMSQVRKYCFYVCLSYMAFEKNAALKILLQGVAVICLQIRKFPKATQNREV